MPYFPLSQIKTNLVSSGEFALVGNQEIYYGSYWKTSTGKFFTGKTPQDLPTREIIPIFQSPVATDDIELTPSLDSIDYNNITITTPTYSNIPQYIPTPPTEQDYQNGEFTRYFCKKSNELIYIEIDKPQYDLLISKSPDILWQLYLPFILSWQLTGAQEQVFRTNRNITVLTSQRLQLPRLGDYLNNNYLKYYR
jgi:hypothetical protein